MYCCPGCNSGVQDFELDCPECGVDLRLLAMLNELPDAQFNQALKAAKNNDWSTAVLLLGSVLSVRMNDLEAWLLLGTLYARRGVWDAARDCWNMVLVFQPSEARARAGLAAMERIVQTTPADSSGA